MIPRLSWLQCRSAVNAGIRKRSALISTNSAAASDKTLLTLRLSATFGDELVNQENALGDVSPYRLLRSPDGLPDGEDPQLPVDEIDNEGISDLDPES